MNKKTFEQLVRENKQELMQDKEKLNNQLEKRLEKKRITEESRQ